jgi:hypothetical protein
VEPAYKICAFDVGKDARRFEEEVIATQGCCKEIESWLQKDFK